MDHCRDSCTRTGHLVAGRGDVERPAPGSRCTQDDPGGGPATSFCRPRVARSLVGSKVSLRAQKTLPLHELQFVVHELLESEPTHADAHGKILVPLHRVSEGFQRTDELRAAHGKARRQVLPVRLSGVQQASSQPEKTAGTHLRCAWSSSTTDLTCAAPTKHGSWCRSFALHVNARRVGTEQTTSTSYCDESVELKRGCFLCFQGRGETRVAAQSNVGRTLGDPNSLGCAETAPSVSEQEMVRRMSNFQGSRPGRGVGVEKTHRCKVCGKSYRGVSGLKVHMMFHTGRFPFWCEQCRKGFTCKGNFEYHTAKHEGRSFPCDLCFKQFQSKRNLTRHKAKEHGVSPNAPR